jgi:hypothetical protein
LNKANKDSAQSDKFKAMAKEVEAEGDEALLDKVMKKISSVKNKSETKG